MQLDDLFPESRRVRGPCSWHVNTFPLQSEGVHETGGTPELVRLQKENEQLRVFVSDLTLDKLILGEAARGCF